MPWENAQKCADLVKVVGYNYAEKYYHNHHTEHPKTPLGTVAISSTFNTPPLNIPGATSAVFVIGTPIVVVSERFQ